MKRHIRKIIRMIIMLCFTAVVMTACGVDEEEIFGNIPGQVDEENEKKSKPGG